MVANHPEPDRTSTRQARQAGTGRVCATTYAGLIRDAAPRVPVYTDMRWYRRDPWAVTFALRCGRAGWREWQFAVELLRDAFTRDGEPAGEGDVRVSCAEPGKVWLELSAPSGRARLVYDRAPLRSLLARIDAEHPPWQPLDPTVLDTWLQGVRA